MNSFTIELNSENGKHLYEQIYEYIKAEIREGKLLCNEKLPSTRSLAEYLQVSRSTVDLAYEQLVSEGYIEARPCKGYYVCKLEGVFQLQIEATDDERKSSILDTSFAYDFSPNGIDMSAFPFATWKRISKEILRDNRGELFALGSPKGDWELRATISRYLHSSRGVNCSPEQVIVGAGNDYLLMLLSKILETSQHVAMDDPTYKRAYRMFTSCGYQISAIAPDESGMQLSAVRESGANLLYVMPSHQYPTGIVMPIGLRMELLKWAGEKEDRYIIEDDHDSEFRYKGKPIPALQGSDRSGKVIYIGTFSKAIAPAIRVSYMVLPRQLLCIYENNYSFLASTVSRIDQMILNEFICKGHFERHLNKMRKLYKGKHDVLLKALKPLEKQFAISGENAGLHLLLTDKKGRTETELLEAAKAHDVKVYGMSENFVHANPEKTVLLLGYAGMSEEEIIKGIDILQNVWKC